MALHKNELILHGVLVYKFCCVLSPQRAPFLLYLHDIVYNKKDVPLKGTSCFNITGFYKWCLYADDLTSTGQMRRPCFITHLREKAYL